MDIEFFEADGSEPVYNSEGDYLFSLDFSEAEPGSAGLRVLAICSLMASLLFFFAGCCSLLKHCSRRASYLWLSLISLLIISGVVAVFKYSYPPLLTETELFQPEIFASRFFPSLGALVVFTLSALILGGLYYLFGKLEKMSSVPWRRGSGDASGWSA